MSTCETREKIESKIAALRQARKDEVDAILKERQMQNDKVGSITGNQGAQAVLTINELEITEQRYNGVISGLNEQLRILRLDEIENWLTDMSPDEEISIEERLEAAKAELAAAEAAMQAFTTKKKNYENQIKDRSSGRIRFKPQARLLSDSNLDPKRAKEIIHQITHY